MNIAESEVLKEDRTAGGEVYFKYIVETYADSHSMALLVASLEPEHYVLTTRGEDCL